MLIALTLLTAAILAAIGLGKAAIPLDIQFLILGQRLLGLPIPTTWPETYETILLDIRLPRIVLAALVGSALAGAGVGYQGLFRNPLADPYLMGIAAGAGLGAVIALALPLPAVFGRCRPHPTHGVCLCARHGWRGPAVGACRTTRRR